MFGNLKKEGLAESQDRVGGFTLYETDIYLVTVKAAYGLTSKNGAKGMQLIVDMLNGSEYREQVWATNREGNNWYKDDAGNKQPLAGFTLIDDLCMLTTDKELSEQVFEDKTMNVYDPDLKREVPKSVPMAVELLGKQVYLAIRKNLENKNEKQADGSYKPTAETRETNSIEKALHFPTKLTVPEARQGATTEEQAVFFDAWLKQHKGKVRDRREVKDGGQNGNAGRPSGPPQAGNGAAKATPSLFGKK